MEYPDGLLQVTFRKDNGEIRTLIGAIGPTGRSNKPGTIPIYTAEGWRSFREDSVIELAPFNPVI